MSPSFIRCRKAIDRSDIGELQRIIKEGGLDVHEAEAHGRTLLMFAVSPLSPAPGKSSEIVQILLKAGADPNQRDREGWNAVHFAARDNTDMLRMLLAEGGDPNAADPHGNNPIAIAILAGQGNVDRIELLLDSGADPTVKNKYGNSALDTAKKMGVPELLALLER